MLTFLSTATQCGFSAPSPVLGLSLLSSVSVHITTEFVLCPVTRTYFQMLNNPGISGVNSIWSWCIILSTHCGISLTDILLRIFVSDLTRHNGV